jgi:branched-chain amino acid aminotransferase
MNLARELGYEIEEDDIDLFDAYNADELFITSTSFCICPVQSINGRLPSADGVPGPITRKLINAYVDLVEFDWYGQYLSKI